MESLSNINRFSSLNNDDFMLFEEAMLIHGEFATSYKYKRILTDLKSNEEEKVNSAVIRFCSELTLEETPSKSIECQSFLKQLLKLLSIEFNADIKSSNFLILVQITLAISLILELIPSACMEFSRLKGLDIVCRSMFVIETMEIFENNLRILEKVFIFAN